MAETPKGTVRAMPRAVASRVCLLVMGDGISATHPLPESGDVSIGRSPACDVFIDDPSISRRHAVLHLGSTWTIEDAGSANGTRVGDSWLPPGRPVAVSPGEVIDIGSVMVLIQDRSAPQRQRRLWSHSYFEARLEDECARSLRSGATFAVVQVHGDDATPVADVQEALDEALRAADVVGHYGPGEFEVLLLDVKQPDIELVTERIVEKLRERGAPVKLGIACYPQDGRDPHALIARACGRARGEPEHAGVGGAIVITEGAMQQLHRLVERIATGNISVLILGETGAGKEILAETVHRRSLRADKPFVDLNCAGLSRELLESELFGYERGAFTGAVHTKPGLLETADGGTVFLDEVGEMPVATQVKLLRVLEVREVLRVGGLKPRSIDVRFVSATNRDLEAEVARGGFRQDLYFRLNGITLMIPPLRQRVGEIEGLARAFVKQVSNGAKEPVISSEAMRLLERYAWPGNIRELRNVIERAVLLCADGAITPAHLPVDKMRAVPSRWNDAVPTATATQDSAAHATSSVRPRRSTDRSARLQPPPAAPPKDMRSELDDLERKRILEALEQCGGNQTRAAQLVGISRRTLLKRLDDYGIVRPRKPPRA
ncbi:MAG: sigma 54-interacting transcriptional regulator [Myxococcota bacterium]|nr:sigma 54-interacting transcriptional regulator [Myxococcota bacterium]